MANIVLIYINKHKQRNEKYNARIQQIKELERQGQVFVIRPSEDRPVSRLEKDPEKLKALHALGVQDATMQWQALKEYLAKQYKNLYISKKNTTFVR